MRGAGAPLFRGELSALPSPSASAAGGEASGSVACPVLRPVGGLPARSGAAAGVMASLAGEACRSGSPLVLSADLGLAAAGGLPAGATIGAVAAAAGGLPAVFFFWPWDCAASTGWGERAKGASVHSCGSEESQHVHGVSERRLPSQSSAGRCRMWAIAGCRLVDS